MSASPNYGTATVSADNPWPGLLAFREADQDYFEGRDAETEDLFRLVMRERLTVFFGLSGLGKSSLLQAGLFPLLRKESILPVYVRLDFSSPEPDLIAQVKSAIANQAELAAIEAPASKPGETLWEYFHRQENEFWTRRNRPAVPLIAFDQFEECFTLGKLDARRAQATEALFDQLADLAEGRPPAALKQWLDEHPDCARNFGFARHSYKLVLSIREDFLPELEALRERMPSIALNRLRLQRMNGKAALQVVSQAERLIDLPVAEKVVRFVGAGRSGVPLEKLEIEPALLSVVCRELNGKRQKLHEPKITESLLEGSRDEVLSDFYERTVCDLPVEVRSFIEERLLTDSGFRDSIALENALNLPGVTAESINQLVERRLLRREDRGGVQRLELTHDLLTGVIRASRDRRHQQEAAEKARLQLLEEQERERQLLNRQREEEEKTRAIKELRRTRKVAAIFVLLAIVAITGLAWAIYSRFELKEAFMAKQKAMENEEKAHEAADAAHKTADDAVKQALVLDPSALAEDRIKATEQIATAASQPGTSAADRRHTEALLASVAQSPTAPQDLRSAAEKAVANIRQASAAQIGDLIKAEPNSRTINEVILHHSFTPNIAAYHGYDTIKKIATFQTQFFNWDRLGFHYIVAPDGTIWLGTPLNQVAFHVGKQNPTTAGVMLILDGDSELPTEPQRTALVALLKALFAKLDLKAETNFAPGHGFHHDYNPLKNCPGKLITKELVLSWLSQ